MKNAQKNGVFGYDFDHIDNSGVSINIKSID